MYNRSYDVSVNPGGHSGLPIYSKYIDFINFSVICTNGKAKRVVGNARATLIKGSAVISSESVSVFDLYDLSDDLMRVFNALSFLSMEGKSPSVFTDVAIVNSISIDPEVRLIGLGKMLMTAIYDHLNSRVSSIFLIAAPTSKTKEALDQEGLDDFYRSLGYYQCVGSDHVMCKLGHSHQSSNPIDPIINTESRDATD